ncbi:site-specific integrase, partial [Bacillus thuringiensis]|nr:site-specific integrase [Bacillus thuringiensis]
TIETFLNFTAESNESRSQYVIRSLRVFIELGIKNKITGFPCNNPLGRARIYRHELVSEVWNEKNNKWTIHDGNCQSVFYFDYLPNDLLCRMVKIYISESIREQTNSILTMYAHHIRLQNFFDFIKNNGKYVNSIKDINRDLIDSYRSFLAETKNKTRRADYIGTIKHFYCHGMRKNWEEFSDLDFLNPINEDQITIYSESSTGTEGYSINLEFFPNEWFKENFKRYVYDYLNMRKAKPDYLRKNSMEIRSFFTFLLESNMNLENLANFNRNTLEKFMMYLLSQKPSGASRVRAFGALKSFVKHGQRMNWANFPIQEIFDDADYKILRTENIKKTQVIPDHVLEQIKNAINQPKKKDLKDVLICCLIEILMYTGVRLSEALNLQVHCVKSLLGKKVLHIVSSKNLTERYIAIPKQVEKAIETLKIETKSLRESMATDHLFVFYSYITKENEYVQTKHIRSWIRNFVSRYDIKDNNGSLYALHTHQFRHTLATDMLNTGLSLLEIKEYLGHKDIKSTLRYAKVLKSRLNKVIKDIGFIGLITDNLNSSVKSKKINLTEDLYKTAALPDGICKKPINNEGILCRKLNMCLFCSKFITTPDYLSIHQDHLKRIRNDKTQYMHENYIGTHEHLEKIEMTLEKIITKLEELPHAKPKIQTL